MRRSDLHRIWPLGLMLTCATLAHGQATNGARTAAETARRLEMAKSNREAEAAREAATSAASKRMDLVAQQAKSSGPTRPSFAEQAKEAASQKRLQEAMSRVSPEGKAILTQNGVGPSLRTPDDSSDAGSKKPLGTKASPLTTGGPGPKPQPLKTTPLTPTEKPPSRTIIDAGSSFFDTKSGFGVFVDDVVLNHPEFHLTADELEIYMNKEEPKDADKDKDGAATPAGPTAGELAQDGAAQTTPGKGEPAPSERKVGGNIKTAIAKGKKVLITKMSAEGIPQNGMGREAVYDGATGDMILRGWPQIQKENNLTVATEPSTYFIIKANGNFQALGGRAQTRIVQEDEKKAPAPPPSANPAPPIPAPPAAGAGSKSQGGQQ